jgi:hypothetical protein
VLGSGESGFVAGTYLFEKIVVNCDDGKHVNKFRDRMEEGCAAHGMKPACYTHSLPAQYSLTCINHGGEGKCIPERLPGCPRSFSTQHRIVRFFGVAGA